MSRICLLLLGLLSFSLTACFDKTGPCRPCETDLADKTDYTAFVDTSIGTSYNGHTFIGATMPFGFVQPGPESGDDGWGYCSGYRFEDKVFSGFAQTAISGTGVGDLGDLLFMPFIGEAQSATNFYECPVKKETEKYAPGYYAIELDRFNVKVETTCSDHTAIYRLVYPKGEEQKIMLDFANCIGDGDEERVYNHELTFPNDTTMLGTTEKGGWVHRQYSFKIEFNRPIKHHFPLEKRLSKKGKKERSGREIFVFEPSDEPLMLKIALSTADTDGAAKNMEAEIPGWDFEGVKLAAHDAWNKLLGRVKVEGSEKEKRVFYTCMYHAFVAPSNIADVDGRYRGPNGKISTAPNGKYYSTLSTWDTFRALHPLFTVVVPEMVPDLVQSMVEHYEQAGYLPIWALWGKDNQCMIGTHSIPPMVDAYFKGQVPEGLDIWTSIKDTLTKKHDGRWREEWEYLEDPGYYPCDKWSESVSCTLECSYDDWCAYKLAEALEKKGLVSKEDVEYFKKRSENWKNLIDAETGFARPKKLDGTWKKDFDPTRVGGDFTEGNSWQYTWHVMQDPEGLIEALGGKEKALAKLEALFEQEEKSDRLVDVSGLIGEYAHGNEPSHHVVYMFPYFGRPEKTAELVKKICDELYDDTPEGVCGNEDCGQMSAWYVMSCMGFYPMNPCGGEYVFGIPRFSKMTISVPGQKPLEIEAKGIETGKKIKSVTLNGKKVEGFTINHSDLVQGGELVYELD